jgi:hypothetical protein
MSLKNPATLALAKLLLKSPDLPSCPDIKANMGVTFMGADSFQHVVLDHNTNIHLA